MFFPKAYPNIPGHGIWPYVEKLMPGDRKSQSFKDRLKSFSEEERKKALQLPPGPERDAAIRKIRQAETAAHLDDWANSPELQPPKR